MAKVSEMTQLSPTMAEGLIVKWLKKEGDSVSPGDIIAEVETDKAVMEMEAYDKGTLLKIIAIEGTKVKVGLPVAIIGKPDENVDSLFQEASAKLKASSTAAVPEPAAVPKIQEPIKTVVIENKQDVPPKVQPPIQEIPSKPLSINKPNREDGRLIASPLAKSIALEKGIDIKNVAGTGPGGRITKQDVLDYIASPAKPSNRQSGAPVPADKRIEITGMRKTIANRLHDAKNNIPHFYLTLEFDADPLVKMREILNNDLKSLASKRKEEAEPISVNDFITKACSICLRRVPEVNSSWRNDHILEHGRVDIGIAVSIDGGLITPYVRNADQLSLLELHSTIKELASKARNRKLKPEEFMDGTFTISNLGMFGITSFSAIINEPEAALLAVGGLIEKPIVRNGAIVPGKTISVTLSCDHRVVDGAVGARFLGEFRDIIEHPYSIIR